jgi:DNA-binding NarL/FixJ family response regulator
MAAAVVALALSAAPAFAQVALTPELEAAVQAGDAYFSPAVASRLADAVRADPNAVVDNQLRAQQRVESLTHREREVLVAITRGLLNKEIASEFSISVRTVEAHRESIMRKLGVRTVAAMTRVALDGGLLNENG